MHRLVLPRGQTSVRLGNLREERLAEERIIAKAGLENFEYHELTLRAFL
jgi:hypothetical protein